MRRLILWVLIIGFIWIIISRFTEIQKLAQTVMQGKWEWIAIAVLLQILYYIIFTYSYKSAFNTVDVESKVRNLLPVMLGSIFVNVVAPSGGAAGVALFVDDAAQRNQSASKASVGLLLQLIADFSSFTLILIVGMAYLFVQHDLKLYEIITAAVLLAITIGLSVIISLGLINQALPHRLMLWLQTSATKIALKLKRDPWLSDDWAQKNAAEFTEASLAIARHPQRLARTVFAALTAHMVDITCLFVLFLAFGYPITFGPLVAGYAMGILFWVVSITPQGIGIVEGMMTLVFTSLGVPANIATIVSLVFRGLSFWLPMALGFILLQRIQTFRFDDRAQAENWKVRIVAIFTAMMGMISILSAVTPSLMSRISKLEEYIPLMVRHGGHLTAAMTGFGLVILAGGLWRRKHVAWLLTLIALGISILSHLVKGLDYEEAILASLLAIWLFTLRREFHAKSDTPSIRQGITALFSALVFTLFYGTIGFFLLDRHFSVNFDLRAALTQTVVMFTQFFDPGLEPLTRFGKFFSNSIYIIAGLSLLYALLMLIRPVLVRKPASEVEREQAAEIVKAFGRSSLARVVLFPDKSYFFTPGGSVIGYTAKGHAAVALGDPIGPTQDLPAAIVAYQNFCSKNDWQPAFYQTHAGTVQHYQKASFSVTCIGHEAIVDLETFTLEGHANKALRSAVNRLNKLGYRAVFYQPPLTNELLSTFRSISDEWLSLVHGAEKRFSLGWFEDDYIRNSPIASVYTPAGEIVAFSNLMPEYQINEITIDLMRHRKGIENGTMDFLFVQLFSWAKEQGYATFNLGLSSLSGVGEKSDDPSLEKFLHYIYEHINQFYNFKGLHEFKEKFHPTWSPRYIAYPGVTSLPAVWATMSRADAGDNLVIDNLKEMLGIIIRHPHASK